MNLSEKQPIILETLMEKANNYWNNKELQIASAVDDLYWYIRKNQKITGAELEKEVKRRIDLCNVCEQFHVSEALKEALAKILLLETEE